MHPTPADSTFTLPLTHQIHQTAAQFHQQQSDRLKAKQVYLNTLAVQAVASYLTWFGVETNLEQSQSWQPIWQQLADIADLQICHQGKVQGRLECRPVLPQVQTGYVPPEVWEDRLGFVFVQFDDQLTEATLLGFLPTVTQAELPLQELRSLDELFDYLTPVLETKLAPIEHTISDAISETISGTSLERMPRAEPAVTHLSQWFHQVVDTSWQTVETLWQQGLTQANQWLDQAETLGNSSVPALNFRGDTTGSIVVNRGKLLNLSDQSIEFPVILLVAIQPSGDRDRNYRDRNYQDRNYQDVDIWVRLCPAGGQTHLPPHLDLLILDAAGIAVMQAQSRTTEMMQLRFGAQSQEQFSIQIVLGHTRVTERFVI